MIHTTEPPMLKIIKNLKWVEVIFLSGLALGLLLTYRNIDINLTKFCLIGLSVTYFLYAYKPSNLPPVNTEERAGFLELLVQLILPKQLWMTSAISTLGLFFFLTANKSYRILLSIGTVSIAIALILIMYSFISDVKNTRLTFPVLFRAVPLMLAGIYILWIRSLDLINYL